MPIKAGDEHGHPVPARHAGFGQHPYVIFNAA
jgi:hypothetical protein